MTENHHDDATRPAAPADAPTTHPTPDQPTQGISTGSTGPGPSAGAGPDRPTQALPAVPPAPGHAPAGEPTPDAVGSRWAPPTPGAPTGSPRPSDTGQPAAAIAAPTPTPMPAPPTGPGAPLTGREETGAPALGPLAGWDQGGPAPATAGTRTRWTPLLGTAAAAALLASLATAGLTGAFGPDAGTASTTAGSIATIGQTSTETVPVAGSTSDDPDWEKVAASVAASVVSIQVTTASGGGEGSGVIIDDAGHILTNNHVVSGAQDDTVQVTLHDGRLYEATVVGTDPSTDLAIVRIDDAPDDLSPAALGESADVVVGAPVMAVGNPLGLANTVTTGIVSAVDRPVSASSSEATSSTDVVVTNAIQIDAAINPGNSGGPLFDAQGRVVGITSSIATLSSGTSQSGSIGLGFAIPVDLARDVGQQLIEDGTAEHAFLGVSLTDGTASADGVTRRGAVVQEVTDGSPAAAAELRAGDVIVAIDGEPVNGAEALTAFVRERTAGDPAQLAVVRDGTSLDVTVTLATRETAVAADDSPSGSSGDDGLSGSGAEEGLLPGIPGFGVNPFSGQG